MKLMGYKSKEMIKDIWVCLKDDDISIIESRHVIASRRDGENGGDSCALILENVQILEVKRCGGVTSLCEFGRLEKLRLLAIEECEELEELGAFHFPQLRILTITGCSKLKHLWEEIGGSLEPEGIDHKVPPRFPNLERMSICGCEKLTILVISGCPNLKVVLAHDVWRHLPSLSELLVEKCEGTEVIIGTAPNTMPSSSSSSFPKLTHLELENLPELKSICDGTLSCDSIQWISIWKCPKLKRIALQLQPPCPPSLQAIKFDRQTWEMLEWNNTLDRFFEPLVRINE